MRDVAFKYNIVRHSATKESPWTLWHGRRVLMTRIFAFGQIDTAPIHAPRTKLQGRSEPARYMYPISETHIMTMKIRNPRYRVIRAIDFKPYIRHQDPKFTSSMAFKTKTAGALTRKRAPGSTRHHTLPRSVDANTPAPPHLKAGRQYPDAEQWEIAHNAELDTLDKQKTIKWIPQKQVPSHATLIPLTMTYRHKRTPDGQIDKRKARCSIRGDRMKPGQHFDPKQTSTFMAEKTLVQSLLAIAAAHQWPVQYMHLTAAYLHETHDPKFPVYVRQHPRFDGTMKHEHKAGQLIGNLYGGRPAGHRYTTSLQKHLTSHGYKQCDSDPCQFTRHTDVGSLLVTVSTDYFLVTASQQSLIASLLSTLQRKYTIKNMGFPISYLGWTITRDARGSIHISQQQTIETILKKHYMHDCNPKTTPAPQKLNKNIDDQSAPLPHTLANHYRSILGELRYVVDSTRYDAYHTTNSLT